MIQKPRSIWILVLGLLVFVPGIAQTETYHNKHHHYSLTLPDGWVVVPAREVGEMNRIAFPHLPGMNSVEAVEAAFKPRQQDPGGFFIVMAYMDYWSPVKEARTYEDLEHVLGQLDELVEEEFSESIEKLEPGQPVLDRERNRILLVPKMEKTLGATFFSIGFIGKDGVLWLAFNSLKSPSAMTRFQEIANSFRFDQGYEFRPQPLLTGGSKSSVEYAAPKANLMALILPTWAIVLMGLLLAVFLAGFVGLGIWLLAKFRKKRS